MKSNISNSIKGEDERHLLLTSLNLIARFKVLARIEKSKILSTISGGKSKRCKVSLLDAMLGIRFEGEVDWWKVDKGVVGCADQR